MGGGGIQLPELSFKHQTQLVLCNGSPDFHLSSDRVWDHVEASLDEEGDAGVAGRGIGLLPEVRLQHALDHPLGEVADEVVDERQDDGPVLEIEVGVIALCLVADRKSKLCSVD